VEVLVLGNVLHENVLKLLRKEQHFLQILLQMGVLHAPPADNLQLRDSNFNLFILKRFAVAN
jgi:hypothetical protein